VTARLRPFLSVLLFGYTTSLARGTPAQETRRGPGNEKHKKGILFMADTAEQMAEAMKRGILDKTGKPFDHWVTVVQNSGLAKHGEQMKLLKGEHGLTHGYANFICQGARGRLDAADDDLVAGQYAGRESLRPILETLLEHARAFGDDIEVAPKKTSVALRRSKNFAVITPATKSRVDVGLNLGSTDATDRLKAEKKNAMCTHKVGVGDVAEIDAELVAWLHSAYELAAPKRA
jgi:predicted transport protein